ncbi:MAG: hypothetical protein QW128_02795 [Thermoprotei archaeon]
MVYLYLFGVMLQLDVTLSSLLSMWDRDKNVVLNLIKYTVKDLGIPIRSVFLNATYINDGSFIAEFLGNAGTKYIEIILIHSDNPIKALENFYKAKSLGYVKYQDDVEKD